MSKEMECIDRILNIIETHGKQIKALVENQKEIISILEIIKKR